MNDAELRSFCNEMIGKFKMLSDLQREMQYELIDTKFTEWELKKLIFALDVLRTIADRPQGWIPIEREAPKDGQKILVCYEDGTILGTRYNPRSISTWLAWMPQPKPWKGADDETD